MPDLWEWGALGLAGVVAGAVNTLVGGGTNIILPLLVFLGLDTQVANGTNRIATCFQGLAATGSLRRSGVGRWSETGRPALLALLGGIPGAYLAATMNPERFRLVTGVILLVGVIFFFIKPRDPEETPGPRRAWPADVVAFLLGVYGGFLGAGVGVLILLFLPSLLRLDLVRMVAVKVLMVFLLSLSAGIVFVVQGQVRWDYLVPLTVGNVIGGVVGARLAVKGGDRWIRRLIAIVAALLAAQLVWGSLR